MSIKISTLNLCLGLRNKKYLVKNLLEEKKIDILCMQETEITGDINFKELETSNYNLELEVNSVKSRVGFYVSKKLNYIRRSDLEGVNSNLIIIDVTGETNLRVINVYRTFATQAGESQQSKFKYQLSILRKATDVKFIMLGDFNLDYSMKNDINYEYENLYNDFDNAFIGVNLIQMVEFSTWSRIINNVVRESILDHIYVTDPTLCGSIQSTKPCFGDHMLVSITILITKPKIETTHRRDWRKYSKSVLLSELALVDWDYDMNNVQNVWDSFESKIVSVIDKIVPVTEFKIIVV